ncbi:MAG: cation-translocating P-type ATPase [Acutalibacteraceae bacterium]|nr:cation-translocating P-type ATPase [Acutalibacteraceae bacterium]
MIWHSTTPDEVLAELGVDHKTGLANGVADERLKDYGKNVVTQTERPTFIQRFFSQLKSKVVIILIITALVSFVVSLMYDEVNSYSPLLIIAIVIINALISAYNIYRCDNTLDSIKQYTNPSATVLREGILKSVNAAELVPGDIIILETGDYVPADARIIESNEFRCNEAILTGAEIPVEKEADVVFEDITAITERSNMIFSGCSVVHGTAKAVVVSTGMNTEIGKTSVMLHETGEDKLPLQSQLDNLGRFVNILIFAVCVIVFIIGMIQNFSSGNFAGMTVQMLLNAVALAVAAIPEGLPAITTIVIAIGVHRILQDKIVVKDVSAAELLGKTDVICCDKTGVFTRNKMVLSKIFDGKKLIGVETEPLDETASMVLKLATACSTLENDSTENAIEKACLAYNSMSKQDINNMFPHITEVPFDSERKTMTVITMINERPFAIVKGAPETVIPNCINCKGEEILKLNEDLASDAYRIICIAMRPLSGIPANPTADDMEKDLAFVGLLGLNDPPRDGVVEEIAACDAAGIKTVMITGDNLNTAKSVARRIGILKDGTEAVTGAELNEMTDDELTQNIEKYSVFARVSPSDKLRIVRAWQQRKKIITITGDSVQDADALAQADVGCAIGRFGADVAKGNADIIIANNRFGSVVNAVRESRGLFSNIRKSVYYLFSCNFAEILVVLIGMLIFGMPPVAAVQLLWINLLTDCAPAISLSMEGAEQRVMSSKPLSSLGRIFDYKSAATVAVQSVFMTVMTLIAFAMGNDFGDNTTAMTMAFATLGITQIFHCFNSKFEGTLINRQIFANRFMNISVGVTLFIMLFLIFTPAGALFGLNVLSFSQFIVCLALAFAIVPATELLKIAFNR